MERTKMYFESTKPKRGSDRDANTLAVNPA